MDKAKCMENLEARGCLYDPLCKGDNMEKLEILFKKNVFFF